VRGLRLAYEATAIRKLLYDTSPDSVQKPALDVAAVERGRRLFFDQPAGNIINQQILVDLPRAYLGSEACAAGARTHRRDAAADSAHSCPLCNLPLGNDTKYAKADPGRGLADCTLHRLPLLTPAQGLLGQAGPAKGEGRAASRRSSTSSVFRAALALPKMSTAVAATTRTRPWPRP